MTPTLVTEPNVIIQIQKLRSRVWREQGLAPEFCLDGVMDDPHDKHASHWAFFDGPEVIAAARLSIHSTITDLPYPHYFSEVTAALSPSIASMDRLVVASSARRHGLGRLLDQIRISHALSHACHSIVVVVHELSGVSRIAALERLGFQRLFPSRTISDIEWGGTCTPMSHNLSRNEPMAS